VGLAKHCGHGLAGSLGRDDDSQSRAPWSVFLKVNTNICSCLSEVLLSPAKLYRGADKSLARPTSRCILFDGENISFDASLVIYTNSTNISPIMITNRIHPLGVTTHCGCVFTAL
jgi:hypothetical protein